MQSTNGDDRLVRECAIRGPPDRRAGLAATWGRSPRRDGRSGRAVPRARRRCDGMRSHVAPPAQHAASTWPRHVSGVPAIRYAPSCTRHPPTESRAGTSAHAAGRFSSRPVDGLRRHRGDVRAIVARRARQSAIHAEQDDGNPSASPHPIPASQRRDYSPLSDASSCSGSAAGDGGDDADGGAVGRRRCPRRRGSGCPRRRRTR